MARLCYSRYKVIGLYSFESIFFKKMAMCARTEAKCVSLDSNPDTQRLFQLPSKDAAGSLGIVQTMLAWKSFRMCELHSGKGFHLDFKGGS